MFFATYVIAELRRRRGRTILTAVGLAVGVGLVVTVHALQKGLDDAQHQVIRPLTGAGTDMSVTRPLRVTGDWSGRSGGLFSQSRVAAISHLEGVSAAAGSLTLTDAHVHAHTVTGVDETKPDLAPVTPSQITKGAYFTPHGPTQAILSSAFADTNGNRVGSSVTLGGHAFTVVGIASSPLGGTSADAYVKLAPLQRLAGDRGRVSTVQVRAASPDDVAAVSREIAAMLAGSQVTTAQDIADRFGGPLADARSLASRLGTAVEVAGLAAAVLIACLLSLASVAGRVREIGTLKAVGWSQWQVVRQISGESLLQALLGGALGAAIGIGAAAVLDASGWTLRTSVSGGHAARITSGSTLVRITAHSDLTLVLAAVGLAVLGGLAAGTAGGLRAARVRPAAALRAIEW
jgi:putative ABC transport system permease protein